MLNPDQWRRVGPHLDRALESGPEERAAQLAALEAEDPALAAELGALLAEYADVERERFLEREPLRPSNATLAGQAIGAYTLVEPIGQGGKGSLAGAPERREVRGPRRGQAPERELSSAARARNASAAKARSSLA